MSGLTIHDRPNSYIGRSVSRPNIRRLVEGKGRFTDDMSLPRMLFAAFLRSPYAHAEIVTIDTSAAEAAPGVVRVVTGKEMADVCSPWVGVLSHLEGLRSQPQYALPIEKATWQGEAVVAVVADTRAQAEDAVELVEVEWNELPWLPIWKWLWTKRPTLFTRILEITGLATSLRPTGSTPFLRPQIKWWKRPFILAVIRA